MASIAVNLYASHLFDVSIPQLWNEDNAFLHHQSVVSWKLMTEALGHSGAEGQGSLQLQELSD